MRQRLAAMIAVLAILGAVGWQAATRPLHPRYDEPSRSKPLVVRLDAYTASGGNGTGGSGHARSGCDFRCRAWRWARTQRGKWYGWGGTGPSVYDCSGLVYAAFRRFGRYFGRDTYQMLHDGGLYQVRRPKWGDLAFFGTGHVEFWAGRGHTFGAHESGERISRVPWNSYWHPTVFMRVRR
jgi:hypothetical protein